MAKRKGTKGQTTIYKTLHRKLKIKQHKPQQKPGLTQVWKISSSCSTCERKGKKEKLQCIIAITSPTNKIEFKAKTQQDKTR